MTGQKAINCPQCGSNKVKKVKPSSVHLTLAIISTIFIVTLPLAVVFFISWGIAKKKDKGRFACIECKHGFTVSDETMNEYKNVVKTNEKAL